MSESCVISLCTWLDMCMVCGRDRDVLFVPQLSAKPFSRNTRGLWKVDYQLFWDPFLTSWSRRRFWIPMRGNILTAKHPATKGMSVSSGFWTRGGLVLGKYSTRSSKQKTPFWLKILRETAVSLILTSSILYADVKTYISYILVNTNFQCSQFPAWRHM